jgi:hypothetical protein
VLQSQDELGHRLLGHLRALGEHADARAVVVEPLHDLAVGRADLGMTPLREPAMKDQVAGAERLAEEDRQVLGSPPGRGVREVA